MCLTPKLFMVFTNFQNCKFSQNALCFLNFKKVKRKHVLAWLWCVLNLKRIPLFIGQYL